MMPLFASFTQPRGIQCSSGGEGHLTDFASLFLNKANDEERVAIVIRALSAKLARALSVSVDDIEHSKQLHACDYGVDSLMEVELRNWIARDFGANVAVSHIMGGTKIAAIGEMVV
ncbi:hypothetical protein diail_8058 [Diaporthe ilicicola]|nr:hypothetical protein diail_8058 [Diaporthe ilicicola]